MSSGAITSSATIFSYSLRTRSSTFGPRRASLLESWSPSPGSPSRILLDFCSLCRFARALILACSCFSLSGSARVPCRVDRRLLARK